MEKVDFKKKLKHLYKPSSKRIEIVQVPKMKFILIDGRGNPNTSLEFKRATEALFSLAYAMKFMVKKGSIGIDYGVLPLEGLWWVDDMTEFDVSKKDEWEWTLMIMQPTYVTKEIFIAACEQVARKKKLEGLKKVRFDSFIEGESAQIMHIGPFENEGPTIAKLHDFVKEQGYLLKGKHHEIYLSDIRRAAPEKWKTILRQPICKRTKTARTNETTL